MREKSLFQWRKACEIAGMHLRVWLKSYKTLMMLLFIAAFVHNDAWQILSEGRIAGQELHAVEAICYYFSRFISTYTYGLLFLIAFQELPPRSSHQNHILMRASRSVWMRGQVIYCLGMAVFLGLFVAAVSFVVFGLYFPFGQGWSEELAIAKGGLLESEAKILPLLRKRFTPFSGLLLSLVPFCLFYAMLSLIQLMFSIKGKPEAGSVAYLVILLFGQIFYLEALHIDWRPGKYGTLAGIFGYAPPEQSAPRLMEAVLFYSVAFSLLFTSVFRTAGRMDLRY